ncbi:MAG: dienelactone hydrolase family protein [Acidimicrobiales bacterium]|nr:dienelactone hydrolase family protein [Acidimicrobiia bacterium]NNC79374.1 dienelactone hydrolase family protein [Acidimicrobiales bacterium]
MTSLTASDGHQLDAYEVHPDGATAAVVIIQEIFGVNHHIRSAVDRYAELGYRTIAPAMFDRVERGVELDYNAEGVATGRELRPQLDWDTSMLDVAAAIDHVAPTGPVAVIGYCYGGSIAWLAAHDQSIAAAVGYYGGQVHDFRDRAPQVPTMLHFGAEDAGIPLDGVEAVAQMYPDVPIHIYEGAGHGFNCDARGSYNADASALALDRTLDFIRAAGVA